MRSYFNPRIAEYKDDPLYHFGLNKNMSLVEDQQLRQKTLPELFGDTRMVCMGGSPLRAERLAVKLSREFAQRFTKTLAPDFDIDPDDPDKICNLSLSPDRLHLYKIGPVLSISHGMGIGSSRIAFHEIIKLLFYAGEDTWKVLDRCEFIRIGTCGGIKAGLGDVVLGDRGIHPRTLQPVDEIYYMGETLAHPAAFDMPLRNRLHSLRGNVNMVVGDILASNCFYREEPSTHGAVLVYPGYNEDILKRDAEILRQRNIAAVEMESTALAGICGLDQANIPAADICAVVDALGVPIKSSKADLKEYSGRAEEVVVNYIRSREDLFKPHTAPCLAHSTPSL